MQRGAYFVIVGGVTGVVADLTHDRAVEIFGGAVGIVSACIALGLMSAALGPRRRYRDACKRAGIDPNAWRRRRAL